MWSGNTAGESDGCHKHLKSQRHRRHLTALAAQTHKHTGKSLKSLVCVVSWSLISLRSSGWCGEKNIRGKHYIQCRVFTRSLILLFSQHLHCYLKVAYGSSIDGWRLTEKNESHLAKSYHFPNESTRVEFNSVSISASIDQISEVPKILSVDDEHRGSFKPSKLLVFTWWNKGKTVQ